MTDTILPNEDQGSRAVENAYFKKGCNPFAQTGRSRLQNRRVLLNQQIIKQMRMRAGAENLLRATSNNKVREMVMLELSYVNSNLQLLMEDLESLNSSVEVYQNAQESPSTPLIPLGLKETKEVDFLVPFKDFIREHYGEDATNFEDQISDLMDLRQACRTPSRSESGAELFSTYFSHLSLLEPRFFSHSSQMGIFFTWYDSFTGVPVCQHNISLEKASVLFNMGALYTQIGARCARHTSAGLDSAVDAFQKAAGVLQHLKETFIHTPSYDMSPAMLSMLVRMVLAQAQECLFEKAALPGVHNEFFCLCRMAQEAAKVSDSYDQVHQSMTQTPIRDNVPVFWSTMVQVKTHHFRSLAHYFVATAMIDHTLTSVSDTDQQVKTLSELYQAIPEGRSPLAILTDRKERLCIGKAHLRRSVVGHKEALRTFGLCRHLGKRSTMGHILTASHQRSMSKFSENEFEEDDFIDYLEASDIVSKTDHKARMELPAYMKVKVTDFFHKLGPLSVFSAKQQWTPPRVVQLRAGDPDPGFLLKGDGPVQVQSLDPLCPAATAGLKEGDYIVAVGDMDCKWMGASEVTRLLPDSSEEGVVIRVITMMNSLPMPSKSATYSSGIHKTYSMICLDMDDDVMNGKSKKVTKKMSFLGWGQRSKPIGSRAETPPWARQCPAFPSSYDV